MGIFSGTRTVAWSVEITSGSSMRADVSLATNFASAISFHGSRQVSLWLT
jgi:hypothetical protein